MSGLVTIRTVALILATWALAVVLPLSIVHIYGAGTKSDAQASYAFAIASKAMESIMDMSMGSIVSAARVLTGAVPEVKQCTLATQIQTTFSPTSLTATYSAFQLAGSAALQGCGVMTAANSDPNGNNVTDPDDFGNKISFEVTNGTIVSPACPTLLYGYTVQDLNYISYCISESTSVVDYAGGVKYSGRDYGMADFEKRLMLGQNNGYDAIVSPVFDLVGRASISFEVAVRCNPNATTAYALAFAQTNLELISTQFAVEFGAALNGGVAYMVEGSTGLMLAASIADQVVQLGTTSWGSVTQTRLGPNNASNPIIQHSYEILADAYGTDWASAVLGQVSNGGAQELSDDDHVVQVSYYDYPDSGAPKLDWLKVIVLEKTSYLKAAAKIDNHPGLYGAMIVLGLAFIVIAFTYLHWAFTRGSQPARM